MNNPIFRFVVLLTVPAVIGIGIGYSIHPDDASTPAVLTGQDVSGQEVVQPASRIADDDPIGTSRRNAITKAVAEISPTVVGINVTEIRQFRDPMFRFFGDDPFFRQFFGGRTYQQEVKGLGSGFLISADGYIITNDHVAGNAAEITITLTDGRRLNADLIGTDPVSDLSLLKVDGEDLPHVRLGDSDDIVIGEWAIALGNPFGLFEINDKPTVTVGVISSLGMNLGSINNRYYRDMIETDAAINGGNSGGPLVNAAGEVIGVNTLIYTGGQSSTYVGYGFAIPINKVKRIVDELKQKGSVTRDIVIGFDVQPVDSRIARYFGLRSVRGVIVSDITDAGPADKAGVKIGDIILEANNEGINSEQDLIGVLVDATPGETMVLSVYRDKQTVDVEVVLGKK
jgi:serine protease Do